MKFGSNEQGPTRTCFKTKNANRAMDRITMPSALLSRILLAQDPRQKQVVIGHRGRSPEIYRLTRRT
jgi:hypothetical protein